MRCHCRRFDQAMRRSCRYASWQRRDQLQYASGDRLHVELVDPAADAVGHRDHHVGIAPGILKEPRVDQDMETSPAGKAAALVPDPVPKPLCTLGWAAPAPIARSTILNASEPPGTRRRAANAAQTSSGLACQLPSVSRVV